MRRVIVFLVVAFAATWAAAEAELTGFAIEHNAPKIAWSATTNDIYTLERASSLAPDDAWDAVCALAPNTTNAQLYDIWGDVQTQAYFRVAEVALAPTGTPLVTYVEVPGEGDIPVMITPPEVPRYTNRSAAVVVHINTFATDSGGLSQTPLFAHIGLIHLTYVWPGCPDRVGVSGDGVYDYGGTNGIAGLRQVLRFACGAAPDRNGRYLHDLTDVQPLYSNVGLFAFSHPGLAAINVMSDYVTEMTNIAWFVGRENPTVDQITAMDLGHFSGGVSVTNPLYQYPASYTATNIILDYTLARWSWADSVPYFDINTNGYYDAPPDFMLGTQCPRMYGKRHYSVAMLEALVANGALTNDASWPADVARLPEAAARWPYRSSAIRYPELLPLADSFAVLLLFAERDHVQPARDKPHIHQAWEGLRYGADLWVRLNPDQEYMRWADEELGAASPDNPANSEPANWLDIGAWAYRSPNSAFAELAAVAEMADRQYTANWLPNLTNTLVAYPTPP